MRKDQERALWAYECAHVARESNALDDYEIAVQTFAATLHRSGLAVAVSVLERNKSRRGYESLLNDIAARLPLHGGDQPPGAEADDWPSAVRKLDDVSKYMVTTREVLACATWLRRACRALGD